MGISHTRALLVALFVFAAVFFHQSSVEASFYHDMYFTWGAHHSSIKGGAGDDLELVLDQTSGSGVQSTRRYLFGSFEILAKLIPGNSAGTVSTYYLSSTGDRHDEIDFEFLGNVTGEPYTIHTNVYTQGNGSKEEQFKLWFDPYADYHNYTIHWNPYAIVWYIDSIPIRVFRNYENQGIAFPNRQGMSVYSTVWNADDWACQGGRIKIDWTLAPFIVRFRNFRPRACVFEGPTSITSCAAAQSTYFQLSWDQIGALNWVRNNYKIYDYCKDTKRFNGNMPSECYKAQY